MSPVCEHPDVHGEIDFNRLTDTGSFSADVRITCTACGERFVFLGPMHMGLSPAEPMLSASGTELRAPIQPESWGRSPMGRYPGYTVRQS